MVKPFVLRLSVLGCFVMASFAAMAESPSPVQVILPDDLATALAGKVPTGLQLVPRNALDPAALVASAAAGNSLVWIGSPEGLPPEFWLGNFALSPEPVAISEYSESPLDLPEDFAARGKAHSAFLYSANEFPKHNIDEEIRADFLPILAAEDRFGEIIGYPGVLMSHMAPSLVKGRFAGFQGYFFFLDNPLEAMTEEQWLNLLSTIARRQESQLQVEYVEANYASYRPGERVQVRARVMNRRNVAASLSVRMYAQAPGETTYRRFAEVRRVAGAHSATEAVSDFPATGPDGLHRIRVEIAQDVAEASNTAIVGEPEVIDVRETAVVVLSENWSTPEIVAVDGPNFAVEGTPGFVAGTHYYPSNVWWEWAWRDFRPALAERDFRGMRQAGNRIVRVWADPTLDEISLRAKDAAVWIAASHGITLDVCVFNQWVRDLSYPGEDGAQVDFEFRHPKDFNLYSFSLRNMDHQRKYLQTLARRWQRAGNVVYNLANETYIKNPDESQMDPEVRAWEEAMQPSGERRDSLLFQRWGVELEKAVREAGGNQVVFPGYVFSLYEGGDAYLANAKSPIMAWHGYFSPEGVGETVHYFDAISSSRPLLLEEFGNLGWNSETQYDGAMHYAVASGAGAAMSYEWGISWMARESSFVPLPMRDALDGEDDRWFVPIVDYARDNTSEGGVGIAPWPSGWGYGSIYHGTPFPAEAAQAVQRMSWFGTDFARAVDNERVYVIIPEASTTSLLGVAMSLFKQLWTEGVQFGVWQESELASLPESAELAICPALPTTESARALLDQRVASGLTVIEGVTLSAEAIAAMPRVEFTPSEGVNMITRPTPAGRLHAFYSTLTGETLETSLEGRAYRAGLDTYVMIQTSPSGATLVEATGEVTVDGASLFGATGGRATISATDGLPLQASQQWKVAVSATPLTLSFTRPLAHAEVLVRDGAPGVALDVEAGATRITIDKEAARYPVLLNFAGAAASSEAEETPADFVALDGMSIQGPVNPSEAEIRAARAFNRRIEEFTGAPLPITWGGSDTDARVLHLGTRHSCPELFQQHAAALGEQQGDAASQSYLLSQVKGGLLAIGAGDSSDARAALGLGYALGDLLRRLDKQDGVWGFSLPDTPIVGTPAMPNRTLYLMNSDHMNPGLSLEYFNEQELEAYADFLIEARYSRVSLWQWTSNMLYPGNFEENRPRNQMTHRAMRHLFQYARARGLHVYHQLAPMHANVDLLPDDPKFAATGYYGRNSICWAQSEGRDLAKNMARLEMEYYGPVDGYIVWFYDPGGCFCDVCKPNQAQHLFEQFSMVHELSKTISPGAEFQAVLWPTWCFHEYTDRGIPYNNPEEVKAFVTDFLGRMRGAFGPREITIMDTGELEISNIYNGLVDPKAFKRSAFLYSIMGLPSESMFPFAPFKINETAEVMGKARDRDVEDANFFIQYANVNRPSVFAFGDILYEKATTAEDTLRRFSATMAAGESRDLLYRLLNRLEAVQAAASYDAKEAAMGEVEVAWNDLNAHSGFLGNRAWLSGFILAQKYYLAMARATTEASFLQNLNTLKEDLGAIPLWEDFARNALTPELAASHIKTYWRGPLQDPNIVGLPI